MAKKKAAKPAPKRTRAKPAPKAAEAEPAEASSLTFRERLFVQYYLGVAKGNGSKAAQMAGYGAPASCRVTASRLLAKANIRAAVESHLAGAAMSADEVLARLSEIAAGAGDELFSVDQSEPGKSGVALDLAKLSQAGKLWLIRKYKETSHGPAVELHDPLRALDLLAHYHGLTIPKSDARANEVADDVGAIREFLSGLRSGGDQEAR